MSLGTRRRFHHLEYIDLPFPGMVPWFESETDLEDVEDLLSARLPVSLKGLTLNRLLHVGHASKIVQTLAHLKLQGALPHLKGLVLKFGCPLTMRALGVPPRTLAQITAHVEDQAGEILKATKIESRFQEAE